MCVILTLSSSLALSLSLSLHLSFISLLLLVDSFFFFCFSLPFSASHFPFLLLTSNFFYFSVPPLFSLVATKLSGTDFISSNIQMDRMGPFSAGFTSHTSSDKREAALEIATNIYKTVTNTDSENNDASPKTTSTPLSSSSSTSSSSSSPSMSPGTPPESPAGDQPISPQLYSPDDGMMHVSPPQNKLSPPSLVHSSSLSAKRQSMFLPDHITISQDGPVIQSPSLQLSGSSDDQEDMKEVQIETTNPSHLFWVPFHLHPEIAPNEYNKWLSKHGVNSQNADGVMSPRKKSVTRRKSVLSAQYNPEDDHEDHPRKPAKIIEEKDSSDFLSGVFSAPLEQMGTPPLKTKASLRRSVSLSVSSPTSMGAFFGR
ncbi:hypothetical protein BCR41DRAFT_39856 [Lobosporangium transversale]|uniref:Uncharacterized protein n=1 Tax=Lobosporangium transversale TaxID=64571 RepID=A0A1Y2GQI1_9FUNG|nr:hypothetical protein BCR41DRAFT_39856 [Lobosporangium transversale]ORZ19157.1 hypothetical protein BCR41DRAFT_39856 [Lobosporangium transversale]|eukprot:XP_021882325.1 hypothetical protein BCR41DRAFT_39856 [Lobosporangium transversale]